MKTIILGICLFFSSLLSAQMYESDSVAIHPSIWDSTHTKKALQMFITLDIKGKTVIFSHLNLAQYTYYYEIGILIHEQKYVDGTTLTRYSLTNKEDSTDKRELVILSYKKTIISIGLMRGDALHIFKIKHLLIDGTPGASSIL